MIWIIGSKGMLGHDLCLSLENARMPYIGTDMEVDILSTVALDKKAKEISPDWIINCSGFTAVDNAEDDSDIAYQINRDGVENLANMAAELDIPIIHISTDYVFDGTSDIPLVEETQTDPIGVYGKSKLAGEKKIQEICSKYYIIRTAWLYGQYGTNFVFTMIKLMDKLDSIKVVDDQIGSPTWTRDLTGLIRVILKSGKIDYGIYHFSGDGQCSWYDFAKEIYKIAKVDQLVKGKCEITPCNSAEFPTKAKRPSFSLLSKEKLKRTQLIRVPHWQESIKKFIKGINHNDII